MEKLDSSRKALQLLQTRQHGVLRDILRIGIIANNPQRQGVDAFLVPIDQRLKSREIPRTRCSNQREVRIGERLWRRLGHPAGKHSRQARRDNRLHLPPPMP